uniref:Uncharacterized protein n=1 Tax=Haptolina ericina TaxID=156174 RepID=A0A7S3AZX6_9EUKA
MESFDPDPKGDVLKVIVAHLKQATNIKWVWFDFWCAPQRNGRVDDRGRQELTEHSEMAKNAYLLYLGCSVLAVIDLSFPSRFWTQLELWYAFQRSSSATLAAGPRATLVPLRESLSTLVPLLLQMIPERNAQEIHSLLASPDVTVSNQSDKDIQLSQLMAVHDELLPPTAAAAASATADT